MKSKIIALLLMFLLAFSLVSCGDREDGDGGNDGGVKYPQGSGNGVELPIIPWEPDPQ